MAHRNPGEILNKQLFAPLLEHAISNAGIKAEYLINGFAVCGLCPFNPDVVDYSKCLGKQHKKKETLEHSEKLMTYNDFARIVGADKIRQMEKIKEFIGNDNNNDDNFFRSESNLAVF